MAPHHSGSFSHCLSVRTTAPPLLYIQQPCRAVPAEPAALVNYITAKMKAAHTLKPDNEAPGCIRANDSLKGKTEYALVYLHGFTASQGEGNPVHRDLAKKFGCNLYLSRLAEHGIDTTEPMVNLTHLTTFGKQPRKRWPLENRSGNTSDTGWYLNRWYTGPEAAAEYPGYTCVNSDVAQYCHQ